MASADLRGADLRAALEGIEPPDDRFAEDIDRAHELLTTTVITVTVGDPCLTPKLREDEATELIRHKRIHLEAAPRASYPHVVHAGEGR